MNIFMIFSALRKRGFRFLWVYFSESIWFDLRHGTSTASRVPKNRQTIKSSSTAQENGLLYVASFTSVTQITTSIAHEILGKSRSAISQFVDLGCGKGKALMVYARDFGASPDRPAVGIEYDPVLADLARTNVSKVSFAKGRVLIITDSATNLRAHLKSQVAVIYLYNSFQGETLRATLSALRGLPHVLIYVDPAERQKLADFSYSIVAEHTGRYNADTWLVARSADLDL